MDYKYITQLLERYWQCDTSLEEEQILRTFFCQPDVPEELRQYRQLFLYENNETKEDTLGSDFDDRIMSLVNGTHAVKARKITLRQRLTPLFKAAAIVGITLSLTQAAQLSLQPAEEGADGTTQAYINNCGTPLAANDSIRQDSIRKAAEVAGQEPQHCQAAVK